MEKTSAPPLFSISQGVSSHFRAKVPVESWPEPLNSKLNWGHHASSVHLRASSIQSMIPCATKALHSSPAAMWPHAALTWPSWPSASVQPPYAALASALKELKRIQKAAKGRETLRAAAVRRP